MWMNTWLITWFSFFSLIQYWLFGGPAVNQHDLFSSPIFDFYHIGQQESSVTNNTFPPVEGICLKYCHSCFIIIWVVDLGRIRTWGTLPCPPGRVHGDCAMGPVSMCQLTVLWRISDPLSHHPPFSMSPSTIPPSTILWSTIHCPTIHYPLSHPLGHPPPTASPSHHLPYLLASLLPTCTQSQNLTSQSELRVSSPPTHAWICVFTDL